MSDGHSFFDEIKRRNILRVVTAYAVASGVLLQLGDAVIPALEVPDSSIRYLIIALVIGFPIVVLFSWFYEVTPEGVKPTRQIQPGESISRITGRRIDFAIIGLLSVALIFFMTEYFSSGEDVPVQAAVTDDAAAAPEEQLDARPSIAVLPLVNMSSDVENEHFSDGLTEELLNVLAQNQSLRVAGRTSSFFYKGKNEPLQSIGEALNVEHLLEGSVRKSGDQVRITVQLINADDGFHIWSQTYDRKLTDIFAVQDEISRAVANVMEVTLVEGTGVLAESRMTQNAEAYELYLRAKELLYLRERATVLEAIELLERVTRMDPGFAPPFVSLAEAFLVAENNHNAFELQVSTERATAALDAASKLGFETAEYWATRGLLAHHLLDIDRSHYESAAEFYEKAIALNENMVTAYLWYSALLSEEMEHVPDVSGDSVYRQALGLVETALRLDPLNRVANQNYQINLSDVGRLDEAEKNLRRLRQVDDYDGYNQLLALILLIQGRFDECAELLASMSLDGRSLFMMTNLLRLVGENEARLWWIEAQEETSEVIRRHKLDAFAETATLPEVMAQAQLALLRPDIEHESGPLANRLIQEGEHELARKLIENMHQDFAKETPEFAVTDDHIYDYMAVTYLLGDVERARDMAERKLRMNALQPRVGVRSRGIGDVWPYMVLGRTEEAIIEMRAAWADGWRVFNFDYLARYPLLVPIKDDPRVVDLRKRVEALMDEHRPGVLSSFANAGILDGYPGLDANTNEI